MVAEKPARVLESRREKYKLSVWILKKRANMVIDMPRYVSTGAMGLGIFFCPWSSWLDWNCSIFVQINTSLFRADIEEVEEILERIKNCQSFRDITYNGNCNRLSQFN